MAIINFRKRKKVQGSRPVQKATYKLIKTIQAASVEGQSMPVLLESMLTGIRVNLSVPGTTNAYTNYDSQVMETYKKYNARSDFGAPQTRAVIDLRTALITGEGVSISAPNPQTAEWIENFINDNKFQGERFIHSVVGAEMAGQALFTLKPTLHKRDGHLYIKITRIPYRTTIPYRIIYTDDLIKEDISHIEIKRNGMWTRTSLGDFKYVRTGGDDGNTEGPVTKIGTVLTDIENYDRAVRDIRRLNHILARITPFFKTESASETAALQKWLTDNKWKIGEALIGTAAFSYETPTTGAHDNLKTELITAIKNISATTGVPVHWLGYVDLMSNRSTAQSLYEMIKHATITDRTIWEESLYDIIYSAQELFINSGGSGLMLDPDFEVKLPLIDFSDFLDKVKALSLAHQDEAISMDDYRSALPGIDPLRTEEAVEKERTEITNGLVKSGIFNPPNEGDKNGEE